MMIFISGGILAAVFVVVLFVVAMPPSGGGMAANRGEMKKLDEIKRFGLTEIERKHFFEALFHAVDENGPNRECRDEWRRLGGEKNLSDQQISDILKEGMEHSWTQPAMPATIDQRQKTNRQQWIRTMNETKREPILSQ